MISSPYSICIMKMTTFKIFLKVFLKTISYLCKRMFFFFLIFANSYLKFHILTKSYYYILNYKIVEEKKIVCTKSLNRNYNRIIFYNYRNWSQTYGPEEITQIFPHTQISESSTVFTISFYSDSFGALFDSVWFWFVDLIRITFTLPL